MTFSVRERPDYIRAIFDEHGAVALIAAAKVRQIVDDVTGEVLQSGSAEWAVTPEELATFLGDGAIALAQVTALRSELTSANAARAEAAAAHAAAEKERDALLAQVRALRGTPQFTARRLLDVLAASAEDMRRISVATAESSEALAFFQRLLARSDNEPVVVDSPVFLAALGALRTALGDDARVAEIFRAVNIDVTADPIAYVDLSAAQI